MATAHRGLVLVSNGDRFFFLLLFWNERRISSVSAFFCLFVFSAWRNERTLTRFVCLLIGSLAQLELADAIGRLRCLVSAALYRSSSSIFWHKFVFCCWNLETLFHSNRFVPPSAFLFFSPISQARFLTLRKKNAQMVPRFANFFFFTMATSSRHKT